MIEVEAKYRYPCSELAELSSRLETLGFQRVEERVEVDDYYQHPCRDFTLTDEALRVRITESRVELTYKGPRLESHDYKGRLEATISVDSPSNLKAILENLGFKSAVTVVKKRVVYENSRGVKVSLDEVAELGCFVEIEGGIEEIRRVAASLGLRDESYVRETYAELLLALRHTYRSHSSH